MLTGITPATDETYVQASDISDEMLMQSLKINLGSGNAACINNYVNQANTSASLLPLRDQTQSFNNSPMKKQ